MNIIYDKFVKSLSAVSLQRKLLLFIVVVLSLITASAGMFIYKLVNDTFMKSEQRHIAIIAESLSAKVGVWYFINSEVDSSKMDEFFKSMLIDYKLEYIAFRDKNQTLISEIKSPKYIFEDSYNLEYKKSVYSPESIDSKNIIGTVEIAYGHHMLKDLASKYTITGILLSALLILYFYLEMRLLKGLLMPLRRIAADIKGYMPGDVLKFELFSEKKDDVIFEIVNGFRHMQKNIDEAIAEKKLKEESEKAKDAFLLKQSRFIEMGTMISNIAHQWKQPLNIIQLCITDLTIKSMMGEVDSIYQKKLFKEIDNQVSFMSKTIDIFKNFLEEDHKKKNMELFSIKKAVEDSMQLLDSMLDKKKITIEAKLDESSSVYGSIGELEQVILIIIHNAVDAIMEKSINSGKITIESVAENKNCLIKIYDNGGGFDPSFSDKLFDAYFTTKHKSQGTGLGLFIAKTIVEMKFSGSIEAKNSKEGSLFIIKLPLPETIKE
ncbi:MAG: histidine kinase [Sulfurimonas sp. RIFOXYD12_FULL_33_39]|uniref:sensor histidine kinase n=1 Tax=unclassified Sulfurimonas TaxID=2623549 RepID=UPI0008BC1237|nr:MULTISPECIES: HAMP domain-containing sensor histidine kinase [unclassified Sulfurimonas]OHE05159.1 MAG: histidine kinase [Sulfurimonas sp. RIFCSPLOWO2_12_FULL_34_6]OHE09230.1 MAG: histidine kinase [Sulfurimonas sp. RIFOXYD12_FULL_33_39]OHE12987.1 MAG: histidine kinase [Sulfurimonas sp. RIFOXYD2_FULL_34_21]DAB27282.1 MAG TPA: histidine kinase [Sulfurimonas sp. UBA10385]